MPPPRSFLSVIPLSAWSWKAHQHLSWVPSKPVVANEISTANFWRSPMHCWIKPEPCSILSDINTDFLFSSLNEVVAFLDGREIFKKTSDNSSWSTVVLNTTRTDIYDFKRTASRVPIWWCDQSKPCKRYIFVGIGSPVYDFTSARFSWGTSRSHWEAERKPSVLCLKSETNSIPTYRVG